MEAFEHLALALTPCKTSCFYHYMDDTFVIWPHGSAKLDDFLVHLNSIHPNIKFMMKIEKMGGLPFLNVFVHHNGDGTRR